MTSVADLADMIGNGDVPSFDQINQALPQHPGLSWQIRTAAQGSIADAIFAVEVLFAGKARWHVGYDCRATVAVGDAPEMSAISVTPGHALIVATLAAYARTLPLADGA